MMKKKKKKEKKTKKKKTHKKKMMMMMKKKKKNKMMMMKKKKKRKKKKEKGKARTANLRRFGCMVQGWVSYQFQMSFILNRVVTHPTQQTPHRFHIGF